MRQLSRNGRSVLAALVLATAALYFGKPFLMPVALAVLVSFLLAPLVERVQRTGVGRIPAVIVVCVLIGGLLAGAGWIVARETAEFAEALPEYRANLKAKVQTLRGPLRSITGAAESISDLEREIEPPTGERPAPKVEVVQNPGLLERISGVLTSILDPLGTAAIVAVLAVFMLLEREELRDRLIWLTGGRDLHLTTHAIEDAERRIGRYFFTMSLLCGLHGVGVGLGLWAIGVPGAALWGVLAAVLRFLPYFGPWIAASLPTLVALAAFPGWQPLLLTLGLFVVLELISNNVLEPWLYGSSVGLSPFGVILSAVFWTWVWGLPGLVVATPITVCLVVMGRYVRELEFFPVLLGDQPALEDEVRLYQRLIALDLDEARALLESASKGSSLEALSDRLVFPVLRRLALDDDLDLISDAKSAEVRERLLELLDELLAEREPAKEGAEPEPAPYQGVRALCVAARTASDEAAARWVERMLAHGGASAECVSAQALVSEIVKRVNDEEPDVVCVNAITPASMPHARLICTRLRRPPAGTTVLVGMWAAPHHERMHRGPTEGSSQMRFVSSSAELETEVRNVRVTSSSGAGGASSRRGWEGGG
jgi:predicted PurR-regulated permease PerM